MYKHFIAVRSVYSRGLRIAWHYSDEDFDNSVIKDFLKLFKSKHGDLQLGIHRIATDSIEWESVVESDSYFKDVIPISKATTFVNVAGYDQKLSAVDIAKYILTIIPVTQLKLQKLIYFAYVNLLKSTGKSLFNERILAWKHGPVVREIYEEFRQYGSSTIPYEEDDNEIIISNDISIKPSLMRILSSEEPVATLDAIHKALIDYGEYTAWQLVEITHEPGKPWRKVYEEGQNHQITDDLILSNN